eukprot:GHVL01016691.1.p1 GENE.GHVL01016691.1~~GHVL01016691.1.p1  ORF type:complete len:195 (+),score=42.24 GHVL01016691.1:59-643(+)
MAFKLTETAGDLFLTSKNSALAHCVSADLRMGKGIAVQFKERFKGLSDLELQNPTVGGVCVLERDNRFVYYLITKEKYYQKPTLSTITSSLESMKLHMIKNNVVDLAIPRIGCGLDGLHWADVKAIILKVFQSTVVNITVCYIAPERKGKNEYDKQEKNDFEKNEKNKNYKNSEYKTEFDPQKKPVKPTTVLRV